MEILLIRHGETHANIKKTGEPILTSKGKNQIKHLAKKLEKTKIEILYSSDLKRTLLTAKTIQKRNLTQLIILKELREIYRKIVGGPEKQVSENRFERDLARAEKVWKKMNKKEKERIAIICHGNIIRYFLMKNQNKELTKGWSVKIDPASITTIKNGKVEKINDISHLPEEFRSEKTLYHD
ncbi:MAG: histidine phosphatase family protein [Nanoarchaeota archaeon]|nr:histidine phosphatase family protein [Nanoarchaeota archaeon]